MHDSQRYRNPGQWKKFSTLQGTFSYNLLRSLMEISDLRASVSGKIGTIRGTEYLFLRSNRVTPTLYMEYDHICDALVDMRDTVTAAGGTYAIVYVPEKIRVLGPSCEFPPESGLRNYKDLLNPMREWLTKWCAEKNIRMLDLTDALIRTTQAGAVPWFTADTHPNAIAHRVATEEIKRWDVVDAWLKSQPLKK